MAPILTKNSNALLFKYSDLKIKQIFQKFFNSNIQFSAQYVNDPTAKNFIIDEIVKRHIRFRDALFDPISNFQIIEEHQKYFWDPNEILNSQIRGPQAHLSQQMFSEFGFSGNDIQKTFLSGAYLGKLVTTKNPSNISYPSEVAVSSPHSFRQGCEIAGAIMQSSSLTQEIFMTNDDISHKNTRSIKILHSSKSINQKACDYLASIDKPHLTGVCTETDNKISTLEKAMSVNHIDEPRSVFPGAIDIKAEQDAVRTLASRAIMGLIKVHHFDPLKKHNAKEIDLILKNLNQSGNIEEARELVGFPIIISNRNNIV